MISKAKDGICFALFDAIIEKDNHGIGCVMFFNGLQNLCDFFINDQQFLDTTFTCTPYHIRSATKSQLPRGWYILRLHDQSLNIDSSDDSDYVSGHDEYDGEQIQLKSGRIIKKTALFTSQTHPSFYRGKHTEDLKKRRANANKRLALESAEDRKLRLKREALMKKN